MLLPICADGPAHRIPRVTAALVLVNLGILIFQLTLPEAGVRLLYAGGAIPYEVVNFVDLTDGGVHPAALVPPPFTIFTAMFLHGGIEHLVGNLWFLWIFGRRVENRLGSARFAALYFGVGVIAAIAQVGMTPESRIPMVGASGAIAGVLGAYMSLYPRARVQVLLFLVFLIEVVVVPAFVALGAWLLWQVLTRSGDGSVATWAHLAGFLGGFASCTLLRARSAEPVPTGPLAPWKLSPAVDTSSSPL